jgi:transcriptional regulator with XRE-family HTH domain
MRGRRKDLPATSEGMEQRFFDALERVRNGTPTVDRLFKLALARKLKVNITTVALEAGLSRTLIGHDKCAYPKVRNAVIGDREPIETPTNMRSINAELRKENKRLENQLCIAIAHQAALLNRMHKMANEFQDKFDEAERIKARRGVDPNEVITLKIVKPPQT